MARSVVVDHHRLITDSTYRSRMRPVVERAHNWRGKANGVQVHVIHGAVENGDTPECCRLQPWDETERIVWPAGRKAR